MRQAHAMLMTAPVTARTNDGGTCRNRGVVKELTA